MGLLVRNQAVEYRQNALAVLVNAIQIGSKSALKILRLYPFIDDDARHVDILAKSVDGVASKKESIEESRLALRGQRVEIVSWSHLIQDSVGEKAILAMVPAKDQVL